MPKTEVDWSAIEGGLEPALPPALAYEPEIDKQAGRMRSIITGGDLGRGSNELYLVGYGAHSKYKDFYPRGMGMLAIFKEYGVLDDYFGTDAFVETNTGWEIKLRRPNSTGLFKVCYVDDATHHGWQTVHYTPVPYESA